MLQILMIVWVIVMTSVFVRRIYRLAKEDDFKSFGYPKRPVSNRDGLLSMVWSLSFFAGSAHYLLKLRVSALSLIVFCGVMWMVAWKRFKLHKQIGSVIVWTVLIGITVYLAVLMWNWNPLGA